MLRNCLNTALRSLRRHAGYTAINVLGLAVGMACVMLIALYIHHEWSYERFHDNADRIVRMSVDFYQEGEARKNVSTQGVLAPALEEDLPEVEATVRLIQAEPVFRVGERRFREEGVGYADASFFEVFDGTPLLAGSRKTVLDAPGRLVLTETLAHRYFGDANPVGETVHLGEQPLTVSGVMADPPSNTHLDITALISLSTAEDPGWWYTNWHSVNFLTYVLLTEDATVEAFREKLPAFIETRAGAEMAAMNQPIVLAAERLTDLHLFSDYAREGSFAELSVFGLIAVFVLVVACLNFINLSTARSADRAREVGVRKTLGAGQGGLMGQFVAEAVALSLGAGLTALLLVQAARPVFEAATETTLALDALGVDSLGVDALAPWLAGWLALVVVTGVLAGAYPAFVLSRFQPNAVLQGRLTTGRGGAWLRRGLVVTQLAITIGLIAGTAVVYSQLQYMQTRNLGFDPGTPDTGQLLVLDAGDPSPERLGTLKDRLRQHPRVRGVASSITVPSSGSPMAGGGVEAPNGGQRDMSVEAYVVDTAFVDVYDVQIVAGTRPGAATLSGDRTAYVFNETAVRTAGYASPEDILGASAGFWGMRGEVVGVVKDFHVRGLQHAVRPLALVVNPSFQRYLTLRVETSDLAATLADLETTWTAMVPERPFDVQFLDEAFGAQYEAERRFGTLFGGFAILAIVVACLGLLGLVAYNARQRTKELGIRKVLGASTESLVLLLTTEVVALAGVAFLAAVPVVLWGMSRWLETFAYHTSIGAGVLLGAGVLALVVASGTAALQAWRAARLDPATALRTE